MYLINIINHKQFFIEKTKIYFRPLITIGKIISMLNNGKLLELLKISDSINRVETNSYGDLYIELKSNVITTVNGSTVLINKDEFITSYKHGAFGPKFDVEELVNIKELDNSIVKIVKKRKYVHQKEMEKYLEDMKKKEQELLNSTCNHKEN